MVKPLKQTGQKYYKTTSVFDINKLTKEEFLDLASGKYLGKEEGSIARFPSGGITVPSEEVGEMIRQWAEEYYNQHK